jgi:hypothetical protein
VGHTERHIPAAQDCPAGQASAQAPQLARSVCVFTHEPLQKVSPAAQTAAHAPATQDCPAAHTTPHRPQWPLSVCRSTQLAPHSVRGAVHIDAGRQAPERQS